MLASRPGTPTPADGTRSADRSKVPTAAFPAAIALAALFVLFQAWTAGYGNKINRLVYIHDFKVAPEAMAHSALDRQFVVERDGTTPESIDKWMLRFKLYSVDADEMVTVMALARMDPRHGEFDPHMYQYGGAWLYPIGAWFAILNEMGVLRLGPLTTMLNEPERMSAVYFYGRLFVTIAVAIAGGVLFGAIREVASTAAALAGEALFFASPATIAYSLTMKPHWYALIFVSVALFLLARAFSRRNLPFGNELLLGAMIGLAVGCAVTFGGFAFFVWLGLAVAVWRGEISPLALLRVPLVAIIAFAATNPYLFVDRAAVHGEAAQTAAWFAPNANWSCLADFAWNSLLPGFGIATMLALVVVSFREFIRPTCPGSRPLVFGVWGALGLVAVLTANLASWNVNFRYAAYALPAGILVIVAANWPRKHPLLILLVLLTLLQSAPLKLAMADENSDVYGTRLAAAHWIAANIPAGSGICLATSTPVPFDTPPLDFSRYAINEPNCQFFVRVERHEVNHSPPPSFALAKRFRPRLSGGDFAFVFGHVNPQISIYQRV